MAKDLFHDVVKTALIKDGWQITDDPLFLKVGGVDFFIDLGAEKLLVADFHLAIGQFINYRVALKVADPERKLFLAVPDIAYKTFFQKEFPRMVIQQYELELFVYDIENEVIVLWQV
jgi:hypothetical protein